MNKTLGAATTPFSLIAILVTIDALAWMGVLPQKSDMFMSLSAWLAGGGILFILILAIIENVAIVNVYFPGSIAILAAMAGSAGEPTAVLRVWIVVTCGYVIGLSITYWVVRLFFSPSGPARESNFASNRGLLSSARKALFTFWHPHLASLTAIVLAQRGCSYSSFAIIASSCAALWNAIWTCVILAFGNIFSESGVGFVLVYAYLFVWLVWSLMGAGRTSTYRN